jgi:chromosome segregation ATPase
MGRFVGGCVGLFVLAVGFVVLTQGPEVATLTVAFRSEPPLHQAAWAVVVLVPLVMLPFAVWLWDTLVRQRQTVKALELRLDGVRQGVNDLADVQDQADADVQHLTLTDPEDAISALKRRVAESERFAEVQRRRNDDKSLQERIDDIRAEQEGLKERLAPVLETRRSLEQIFLELDSHQNDIDRALAEIASGDDALALDVKLKNLSEFVRRSHARCDQIEYAAKMTASLNEACRELSSRLLPFAAPEDGINSRVRDLTEKTDRLATEIDLLEHTPEGMLTDRVQKLTATKQKLGVDVSQLDMEFSSLAGLRKDISGLFSSFDRAIAMLANGHGGDNTGTIEDRVEDVSRFIDLTHRQLDDVDRRMIMFGQLKTRLGELQSRLTPLESNESGVVKIIEELEDVREDLIVKIRRIEGGGEGDLAARVKLFAESKRELEDRVSSLADQFTKLATIRSDIAGLFDKLSSAVSRSSN